MAVGLASPAFTTPPDILVSADARLIALRSDGAILLHKTNGGSGFTQDAWQQYWALPPPVMLDCPTPNCLLRPRPGDQAAQLLRDAADASACDAALLISAEPIHLDCPKPVPTIDRFTVWREGAQAVWLHPDGVTIVSDRGRRGERPWVLGPPLGGRIPPGTKAALAEKLPD
jgi:competence protein ComEC